MLEQKLSALTYGQSMLTRVRKINGNKFQIELAEKVQRSDRVNVTGILNEGDDRFNQGKPRRAWTSAELDSLVKHFGMDKAKLESLPNPGDNSYDDPQKRWLEVGKLNPAITDPSSGTSVALALQIEETITPDEYQAQDPEGNAKKLGEDGEYIVCNETGEYIFSNTRIVGRSSVKHTFVAGVLQSEFVATGEEVMSDNGITL